MLTIVPLAQTTNQQAIKYLETLLEDAKAGRITEFAIAYKEEGKFNHCWTGSENLVELLGYISRMQQLVHKRMDNNK